MRIRFLHKVDLIYDERYPASGPKGCLRIVGTGLIIDAEELRKDPDARIVTDDAESVCRVLGIQYPDKQVIESIRQEK